MDTYNQNAIEIEQLEKGLVVLNGLAREEYHEDLDSVLRDPTRTQDERLLRIGRLLGVLLKEPFAKAVSIDPTIDPTTSVTGAYRAWELDGSAFDIPEKQTTWQYEVLESLYLESLDKKEAEEYREAKKAGLPETVKVVAIFAQGLQGERSFFWYLAVSTRKHICREPALRKEIEAEVKASQQGGGAVQLVTMGTASTTVATALVQHVPWLAGVGAPLIAGLVLWLMLYISRIGIDAFCQWAGDYVVKE